MALVSEIFRNPSDKMTKEKKDVVRSECGYLYEGLFWLGSVNGCKWALVSSQGKEKFILSQLANYEEHIRKNGMVGW